MDGSVPKSGGGRLEWVDTGQSGTVTNERVCVCVCVYQRIYCATAAETLSSEQREREKERIIVY